MHAYLRADDVYMRESNPITTSATIVPGTRAITRTNRTSKAADTRVAEATDLSVQIGRMIWSGFLLEIPEITIIHIYTGGHAIGTWVVDSPRNETRKAPSLHHDDTPLKYFTVQF